MKIKSVPALWTVLCVLALAAACCAAPRLKYPFVPEKLNVTSEDRLLVVAPHPDDEALGAGGLLALCGPQTDVLVLTDGARGHKGVPEDAEREVRTRQFLSEMQLVRPHRHIMLGLPDAALWDHKTCLNDFDMSPYTKVFVAECDAHPDHAAACAFVTEKLWGMARRGEKVPELYLYEVHKPLGNVSHALDITAVIERKRAFIRCHEDQMPQYCYEQIALDLNRLRASQQNNPDRFFEAYCQITPDFSAFARALFPDGLPQDPGEAAACMKKIEVPILPPGGTRATMTLELHPQLEKPVQRAFAEMADAGFPIDPSTTGGFRWSVAQKTGVVSKHAYGLAIDLNWEHNAAAYTPQWTYSPGADPLSVTSEIASIWKRHGFYWGGDFPEDSRDPMHFCFTLR